MFFFILGIDFLLLQIVIKLFVKRQKNHSIQRIENRVIKIFYNINNECFFYNV